MVAFNSDFIAAIKTEAKHFSRNNIAVNLGTIFAQQNSARPDRARLGELYRKRTKPSGQDIPSGTTRD